MSNTKVTVLKASSESDRSNSTTQLDQYEGIQYIVVYSSGIQYIGVYSSGIQYIGGGEELERRGGARGSREEGRS